MKRFTATIKLGPGETAQNLLAAMFSEEFNPQNAIMIQNNMAIVEVFFDEKPPQKIATAIGGYSDVGFKFGEVSGESLNTDGLLLESHRGSKKEVDILQPICVLGAGGSGSQTEGENEEQEDAAGESGANVVCAEKVSKTNRGKTGKGSNPKRKAPDIIPEVQEISGRAISYQQFAAKVVEWLGIEKKNQYLLDVLEAATKVSKMRWIDIERELRNKGYKNPPVVRSRTSVEITKRLTESGINCSFLALVEYVAGYKDYNFQQNIEEKVRGILREMGIEKEDPDCQKVVLTLAIAGVTADDNNASITSICSAAGYGKTDDDIYDAKMLLSNFVNRFLENNGIEMMTAEDFITKLREAVYTGANIW